MGATLKDSQSQYNLFKLLGNSKLDIYNKEKALYWLKSSANLGHKEAKSYLKKLNNINAKNKRELEKIYNDTTTWNQALQYNSTKLLEKMLIIYKSNINKNLGNGYTPLLKAVEKNNLEIIKYLVEHGADLKAKNIYGYNVFHRVAMNRGDYKITEYLTRVVPEYINEKDKNGRYPLLSVLSWNTLQEGGTIKAIEVLLRNGANKVINKKFRGFTPIMVASPNVEVMKLLLKYGANPDIKNHAGRTTLAGTKYLYAQVDNIHGTKKYKNKLKKQYKEAIEYLSYYTNIDRYKDEQRKLEQLSLNDKNLMWERKTSKNRNINEKLNYCKKLKWLNYEDWRLPTAKEYNFIMLDYPILGKVIDGIDKYYMDPEQFPNMVPWAYLIKTNNGFAKYSLINKKIYKDVNTNKKYLTRCVRDIN